MEENDWNPPESGRSTRQSPRTLHYRVPGPVDRRGQGEPGDVSKLCPKCGGTVCPLQGPRGAVVLPVTLWWNHRWDLPVLTMNSQGVLLGGPQFCTA